MSTQYIDGSWSQNEELPQALQTLRNAIDSGTAKRFVCGSDQEVTEEKKTIDLEGEISSLKDQIKELQARSDQSMVVIPTIAEIERICK